MLFIHASTNATDDYKYFLVLSQILPLQLFSWEIVPYDERAPALSLSGADKSLLSSREYS